MNAINNIISEVVAEQTLINSGAITSAETAPVQETPLSQRIVGGEYGTTMMEQMMKMKEKEVTSNPRYSHLLVVPGSFRQPIDHSTGKPGKVICTLICGHEGCEERVERATSDLFTFKGCPTCKKAVSKIEKAQRVLAKNGM